MFRSIANRFKTRRVNPPGWYSHNLDGLKSHIDGAPYRWEHTTGGVIRGTLDKGFGRTYAIEWDEANRTLKLFNKLDYNILGGLRHKSKTSVSMLSQLPPVSVAQVNAALSSVKV